MYEEVPVPGTQSGNFQIVLRVISGFVGRNRRILGLKPLMNTSFGFSLMFGKNGKGNQIKALSSVLRIFRWLI